MRTILFFDDWVIQSRRGLNRRWFSAEPWPGHEPCFDPLMGGYSFGNYMSVIRDTETRLWRMWAAGTSDKSLGDDGMGLCLYTSADGIVWKPHRCDLLVDKNATPGAPHIVFSGEYSNCGGMPFIDERESDPERRYKLAYSDYSSNWVRPDVCRIATSPDGICWTIDRRAVWRRQHVDANFIILFNPYTGKYQWTGRPIVLDRRISLDQTSDWRTFEGPEIILHPDPSDPECVEFYSMPQFFYEGYFIGFLWKQLAAMVDTRGIRMRGKMDSELTYSINGLHWNRTNRMPFLPDRGIGRGGFGSEYPAAMVMDDDGWLRIYTSSYIGEHGDWEKFGPDAQICYLTLSRFRRDGFCAMEPSSDMGHLILRPLISQGGEITINATTGHFGKIRAELRGNFADDGVPFPGYELENSIPVRGDGHFLKLRWKERDDINPLRDRPFLIFLEIDQARLYALRVNADHLFGCVPQTNLVGYFVPGVIRGMGRDWNVG
ncbi:MAG: hypothetical protein V1800_02135 [Candidatus Latescibacterota bacterium]